ncbi:MAG: enoyl-CoA hydratase/isomerase family protein [Elusimicrobia bacterium]|nr:enoyl-CoA hydratase/isomerase family protein [Elusimicrobiota bacterium]
MSGPQHDGSTALRVERDGAVAVVTLHRPEVLNLLDRAAMKELVETLESLDCDAGVRCVVLTGCPKAFCAGVDVRELEELPVVDPGRDAYLSSWDRIGRLSKPVVAAVSGWVMGAGLELALACDIIVAAENAVFCQNEVDYGVMPGGGGTQRLVRTVGKHRATEMVLTGRRLSSREALEFGIVNRLYPDESCLLQAKVLAQEIALKAPLALRAAKQALRMADEVGFEAGVVLERGLLGALFSTADQKEGMKAYRDNRKPVFEGK